MLNDTEEKVEKYISSRFPEIKDEKLKNLIRTAYVDGRVHGMDFASKILIGDKGG